MSMNNSERIAAGKTRLENHLNVVFGEKHGAFLNALKESQAIISGGCVLRHLINDDTRFENLQEQDMDIYVNIKNVKPIREFLCSLIQNTGKVVFLKNKTGYCNSFLYKNKIKQVITFEIPGINLKVDLMYVRNSQSLKNVVKNFDLSCCMNYYDGTELCVLDESENLFQNKMTLNAEYFSSLISGNKFTLNRINKYLKRGFSIEINSNFLQNHVNEQKFELNELIKSYIFSIVFNRIIDIIDTNPGNYLNYTILNGKIAKNNYLSELSCIPSNTTHTMQVGLNDLHESHRRYFTAFRKEHFPVIFNNDDIDNHEFNSLEDYTKLGKSEEAHIAVKLLYDILQKEIKRLSAYYIGNSEQIKKYKNIISSLFKFINLTETGKDFSQFKDLTCYDEVDHDSYKISEYFKNEDKILVKFEGKYNGYDRSKILEFMNQRANITTIEDIRLYKFYDGKRIMSSDADKIKSLKTIRTFTLVRNGLKFDDYEVYTLVPYTDIDKFILS
jgi:hypothetical protein